MIVSVARSFRWTPTYMLDNLYVDDYDVLGLKFWYNDTVKQADEIKNAKPKK